MDLVRSGLPLERERRCRVSKSTVGGGGLPGPSLLPQGHFIKSKDRNS